MEENQEQPVERALTYTINEDYINIPEVDDQTDYFAFISNDDFVAFYGQLLSLRMEVDNFEYPYEEFQEDEGIAQHIMRCNGSLEMKLISILSNVKDEDGKYLSSDVIKNKTHYKFQEISKVTAPLIDKYIEDVKVNYIDLRKNELIFIPDFPGETKPIYGDIDENE